MYVQSSCHLYSASASLIIRFFEVHQTMISEVTLMIMLYFARKENSKIVGVEMTSSMAQAVAAFEVFWTICLSDDFSSLRKVFSELYKLNIINKLLTLFKTTIKGNFVLYRILQAYSMFDINVTGLVLLAVSIIYTTIVANDDASASVIMAPDADQVNTSIWPGVSNIAYLEYDTHNE